MADLYIDGSALDSLRSNLSRIQEAIERPGRELAAMDPVSAGGAELAKRMAEFGEEWSYGVGKLADFAGTAGEALAHLDATFRGADDALARIFTAPVESGPP